MHRVFALAAVLVLGTSANVASVLFSNLVEPGERFGPDDVAFGNTPGSSADHRGRGVAVRFSVPTNAVLSYFQVPLNVRSGANVLNAYLLSDAAGLPGSIVEAYTLTNLPSLSAPAPLTAVSSAARPSLQGGQNYWFAVNTEELDTFAGWTLTLFQGDASQSANMATGGLIGDASSGWVVGAGGPAAREGALAVAGEAVPEPATLLTTGISLLMLVRRRGTFGILRIR